MSTFRKLMSGVATATAVCVLAACGSSGDDPADQIREAEIPTSGPWADVVNAAIEEGTVTMYSIMVPATNEALETAFESAYPEIDLQLTRIIGPEIDARLEAEEKTGTPSADISTSTNFNWIENAIAGDKLVAPTGPNATDEEWVEAGGLTDGLIQTTVASGVGISWNTELVTDAPKGFGDLLDPRYKGKIGIVESPSDPALSSYYQWLTTEYGEDYLDRLAAHEPKFYGSAVPLQEALVSGEIAVSNYGIKAIAQPVIDQGAPIDFAFPTPGMGLQQVTYILKSAAHPNAAQVLYDFMASEDGQRVIANDAISARDGVEGTLAPISSVTLMDLAEVTDRAWIDQKAALWRETFNR